MTQVVLSLFSGIGLLDMGFREAGFCIVRGSDLLWSDDIKNFDATPLKGKINGVIAGVPCQAFSAAVKKCNRSKFENLWSHFYRVVSEVEPDWYLAECVPLALPAATSLFNPYKGKMPAVGVFDFSKFNSSQKRRRLIVFLHKIARVENDFWGILEYEAAAYGAEWRQKIGREVTPGKYPTITGDSQASRNTSPTKGHPSIYVKGDDLLDAFDLPRDWHLPEHARFPRGCVARLLSQGVPVAAAYAMAMCVKEVLEFTPPVKVVNSSLPLKVDKGREEKC